MKLPMIDSPRYNETLPVSGQEFSFRPYFVGEEIGFLTAAEMENGKDLVESLFNIVRTCTNDEININELSLVDFYYTILNIRAKSNEETMEVEKKCKKCEHTEPLTINIIESIFIDNLKTKSKLVSITDKIKLELKPIKANYLRRIGSITTKSDLIFSSLYSSTSKVIIGTEVYNEFTEKELIDNVLSRLTKAQLKKVMDALNKLPSIKAKITSKCSKCGETSEYIVDDMFDFLN